MRHGEEEVVAFSVIEQTKSALIESKFCCRFKISQNKGFNQICKSLISKIKFEDTISTTNLIKNPIKNFDLKYYKFDKHLLHIKSNDCSV